MLRTKLLPVAIVSLLSAFSLPSVVAAAPSLQASIEEVLAEEGLTGAAWSIIAENSEVTLGAAGLSNAATRSTFTTDTRFHVGSVTKSLLSLGVLKLVTTGNIELDAPVDRYLPNLEVDNPWRASDEVTVRHLLDHTSGLDDARMWQMFSERPTPDTPLIEAFPAPESQLRIRARPGSRFSYSNSGYTLLGMIIESVTGNRYESYLDEHLLVPLAMLDSTFSYTTQKGVHADPMLAWGHVDDVTPYAASPVFLRPAAQFTTTARDLARFAQFLLDDGVVGGQEIIDTALMRSRGHPSGTDATINGLTAGYALGIGRRDRHGVVGYCHGGNIVGFVAMLCIYPDEHKAFAYSVNTDSETADYGRIDSLFINELAVLEASPPRSAEPAADIARWHGRYILRPNRFQTFVYLDTVFGAIEISGPDESPTMTSLQQDPRQLRAIGDRLFSANDRTTTSHIFLRGENGEYQISDGFKTYEKVSPAFLTMHWLSVLLGIAGLTWLFVAGLISLGRHRVRMLQRPEAPAFGALVLLFVPAPFFAMQSFMALGDLTVASGLLAMATLLLPAGMFLTVIRVKNSEAKSPTIVLHGLAAIFVLQWCAVLVTAGLIPLTLWR